MNYSIPIGDLMLFIVFCLAVVVGIFLVIVLININKLVKRANTLVDENKGNISKTLEILPETIKNVNDVAVNVKGNMEKAGAVIDTIGDAVSDTAATVTETTEGIIDFAKYIGNIAKIVYSFFSKNKD